MVPRPHGRQEHAEEGGSSSPGRFSGDYVLDERHSGDTVLDFAHHRPSENRLSADVIHQIQVEADLKNPRVSAGIEVFRNRKVRGYCPGRGRD